MPTYTSKQLEGIFAKYKLADNEHERIYHDIIKSFTFPRYLYPPSNFPPVEVIVGGQTGSGKGSLIAHSKKMFHDGNVVVMNSDDYKACIPFAGEVAINYPTLFTKITDQDSNEWSERALQEAINGKYNFIVEGTMRNDRFTKSMQPLREKGYYTILQCLAVPDLESMLCVHERFVGQIQHKGFGRLVERGHHDDAYNSMLKTVGAVEYSGQYDVIQILKRGETIDNPIVIYSHINSNPEIANHLGITNITNGYHSAVDAITKTREELKPEAMLSFPERMQTLIEEIKTRKHAPEEKQQLMGIFDIYEQYQKEINEKKKKIDGDSLGDE